MDILASEDRRNKDAKSLSKNKYERLRISKQETVK